MTTNDSPGWIFFQYVSFAVAILMMLGGIALIDANVWIRAYIAMAAIMLINSSITLSKTIRDHHETRKFHNRIEEAKAEQLLKQYDRAA
jgi:hypothetical protein